MRDSGQKYLVRKWFLLLHMLLHFSFLFLCLGNMFGTVFGIHASLIYIQ